MNIRYPIYEGVYRILTKDAEKWNFYCFMRNKRNEGEHTPFRSALPSFI